MEGASTIIGKPDEGPAEDLDLAAVDNFEGREVPKVEPTIPLDDDADLLAASAAAPGGSMVIKTESSLTLPRNPAGDSKNVLSATDSSLAKDAGSSGFSLVGDSSLAAFADVKLVPSEEGGTKAGSSDKLFGSDALQLSDDELKLMDAGSTAKGKGKPAGSQKISGSSIKLGDEELEVVLGSKTGSDVTQSPTTVASNSLVRRTAACRSINLSRWEVQPGGCSIMPLDDLAAPNSSSPKRQCRA